METLKNSKIKSESRRKFIKRASLVVGAITIVPRHVLGRGFIAPNDKINLGFIGLGKQSAGLARAFTENTNAQIVAGSDVWTTKNEWFKSHVEKVYADKRKKTGYKGVFTTRKYKELLARPDIDAVIVATPDHWHAIQAIAAMESGKDVYCEKPMTLTIKEGQDMVNITKKTGAVLQVGSMQRSWQKFQKAVDLVGKGYIGEVTKVLVNVGDPAIPFNMPSEEVPKEVDWNAWCGPAPLLPYNYRLSPPTSEEFFPDWRKFKETGGGILTDWGAHMFDIAQWGLGMDRSGPVRFEPPKDRNAVRGMRMVYQNGIEMIHEDFGRGWGVRFIGSEGTLDVSRQYLETNPASILTAELEASNTTLDESRGNHYQNWIDAIKNRSQPICDVEIGHRSASIGNICNIAYQLGRSLDWNPEKEKFIGDKEANKMKKRKYRKF
ncbi:Gfo/Idh/MocA family oxidoreductase [Maribacter algarum]|uniref:Gfo/Idh/MocA family oxidoreductase n=1 Tax=Maribacter algarum (ex Zhang et al. 2020) TaxID=2578118 RepID=A0A5S3PQ30_9FLAO|nr:Gfo/Idh/MocA family oxidoreductase [Maribacter algarum]TMM56771.1 Gfo/Idh/MocA family oxidoreductase [Maribacter algarum]